MLLSLVVLSALFAEPVAAGIYDADTPTTYKEYWVDHAEYTGGQVLESLPTCVDTKPRGGSWYLEPSDGCEKTVEFTIADDFSQALRAEIYVDLWRNRRNRPSARFKINEGQTYAPPVGDNWSRTPYIAEVPLSELRQGTNTIRIWDQAGAYHIHDIALRIYYDESHPLRDGNGQPYSAPDGQLLSVWAKDTLLAANAGGTLSVNNDLVVLTANVTTPAKFIEFHAYYDGYDEDNDGVSLDWHNSARNNWHPGGTEAKATGGTINHIGTLLTPTTGEYTIAWRMPHIVSQSGVKFKIRLVDAQGNVRDAAGGVSAPFTLSRTGATAAFVNPNFSDTVLHHDGEWPDAATKPVTIDLTAAAYDAAYLIGAFWNNPELAVNDNSHFKAFNNDEDDWALSVRSINPGWLRNNSNTIGYFYTNGFGQFIEKPGPMIVLKQRTAETDTAAPQMVALSPAASAGNVEPNSAVSLQLTDSGVGIDRNRVTMRVNGQVVMPSFGGAPGALTLTYTPTTPFAFSTQIPVSVDACDYNGNCFTANAYSFTTRPPLYTLAVDQSGQGTVAVDPRLDQYVAGNTVTVTATADAGWTFTGWTGTISGTVATLGNPLVIEMARDHAITALFTQDQYTLTVRTQGNGNGEITVDPAQNSYVYGDVVTLTALPAAGSRFDGWRGAVESDTVSATLTVLGNQAVTATFTLEEYPITVNLAGDGDGQVTRDPQMLTYHYGDVVTLTATAAAGSSFAGWSGDQRAAESPLMLTVSGRVALTATFVPRYYTLTVNIADGTGAPTEGGTVTVTESMASQGYRYNETATLTAQAKPGWSFVGWEGALTGSMPSGTLSVTENATVTAIFAQDHYTITTQAVDANGASITAGTVAISPPQHAAGYVFGETVTVTATASAGWSFVGWSGALSATTATARFTVAGDGVVTGIFTDKTHSLSTTVSDVAAGAIEISPVAPYDFGQVVTLTVVPTNGWRFTGWSGDLNGNANPATIALDGHKVVTAHFARIEYRVQVGLLAGVEGEEGGTVELLADKEPPYVYGDQVTLKATPNAGYRFVKWTVEPIDADATAWTAHAPAGDVNLTDPVITISVTASVTYLAEFAAIGTAQIFLPIIY
ncbi:MAG: hypothetical protein KDE19_01350 [Caldilineaceae bacterium]|nr:hypothetical protein [Caldilineaceae bacterium]